MAAKPWDMGTLFDDCADAGSATVVRLDRPLDIAPHAGTELRLPLLAELVRAASAWLAAAGARPGDRVAIVKDNHWDYDLLACAAIRLGAVPAQLSAALAPDVLRTLLHRLEPAVLVTTAALLRACAAAGVDLAAAGGRPLTLDEPVAGALSLADVRGSRPPGPVRADPDAPLVVCHTSGTTGVPKLVAHSTRTIIGRLARLEAAPLPVAGIRPDDTLVNASSYAHGRTFCWTAVALSRAPAGITILTGADPDRADPLLRAHPPTVVEALPSTYVRFRPLLARLDNPFRDVRLHVSTYDAVHPPVVRAYLAASRRRGAVWLQGWGQTETGPLTFRFLTRRAVARSGRLRPTTRDLGRAVPSRTKLKVVDPDTFAPVPRGRGGLVLVRTRALCLGYVGEPERFQRKQVDGWWSTGDLGVLGRGGAVRLLDREVDAVPGRSCLETEDVLEDRLPQALECVLLGVPGGAPLPVVVTADGDLDPAAWRRAVLDLPPLREPVVLTWADVPRTATGKVRRLALLGSLTGLARGTGTGRWT
jgi:acyl-coenzyme A synthetase/AMP-(fatty) acid ligase